jgi:hypothetical protein
VTTLRIVLREQLAEPFLLRSKLCYLALNPLRLVSVSLADVTLVRTLQTPQFRPSLRFADKLYISGFIIHRSPSFFRLRE